MSKEDDNILLHLFHPFIYLCNTKVEENTNVNISLSIVKNAVTEISGFSGLHQFICMRMKSQFLVVSFPDCNNKMKPSNTSQYCFPLLSSNVSKFVKFARSDHQQL
jgi:hypothetical protein